MADGDENSLRIELSGRPRLVFADGRTLLLEPRDAALLALIALHGPIGRERVFALIWPDCSRKTAQGNLRQRLFRLRKRTGLELVVSDEMLTLARGVEHDLESDSLTQGVFLGDLRFDANEALAEWVDAVRERRQREGSERLAARASQLEAEGRLAQAIDLAERLIEREPTLEHAYRRSMRLHYRRGDRAAALQAYQRCRASLDRLLGMAPSAETATLATIIEQSRALPEPSPAPPPVSLLRPPRLVGRAAAWQRWEDAWRQSSIVVISGEPGIGKSRLVDDFAAAHDAGRIVHAYPGDARMPYTTWARWLREWRGHFGPPTEAWVDGELARMVPGVGEESNTTFAPLRFRHACFDALTGWLTNGLGCVVIDDLQYADEASLETLLAWCSQGPEQRVAVAVRSFEMQQPLVDWLGAQRGRGRVVELALEALDQPAIAELIESLDVPGVEAPEWADELARSTGGNPFFMIELLRVARRPDGTVVAPRKAKDPLRAASQLGRLLAQRFEKLPPAALRLARIAALAGADFSVELAAKTLDAQPIDLVDAWAVLEDAQVFCNGSFVHDLMQESAAASVPAVVAKTLHGAIARALDPARVAHARIAYHALEAGDWEFAAAQFAAAAVDAVAAVRHREAVEFYDRARDCYLQLGDARAAFRVGCRTVDSALHVENEAALDARTLALLQAAEGEAEEMAACLVRAKHIGTSYRMAELIAPAARALTLARHLGDYDIELEASGMLALAFCNQGRHQDGIDLMRAPAARFDAIAESRARGEFAMHYANLLSYVGRAAEGVRWCERGIESGERLGRANDLGLEWANLAHQRWMLGYKDEAVAAGRRSLALYTRHGDADGAPATIARVTLAACLKRVACWEEAERLLEQALAAAHGGFPALRSVFENHLATLYLELGLYARSRRSLATPPPRPGTSLRRAVIEARLDAQSGKLDAPHRLTALMAEHRDGKNVQPFDRLIIRVAMALAGPAETAIPLCQQLRDEAERLGLKSVSLAATARLASAANEVGAYEDALSWARLALADSMSFAAFDMDAPEFFWHLVQGLSHCAPDEAMALVRLALDRVRNSLPQIPEHHRDAYWNRSRFVPRLRALAARGL